MDLNECESKRIKLKTIYRIPAIRNVRSIEKDINNSIFYFYKLRFLENYKHLFQES